LEHQERDPHSNNRNNNNDGEDEETQDEGSIASGDNHTMGTAQSTPPPPSARRQSMRRGDRVFYVRAPGGQRPQRQSSAGDYGTTADEQSALSRSIELASGDNNNTQPMPLWGGLVRLVRRASTRDSQSGSAVEPASAGVGAGIGDKLKDNDAYKAAPLCVKEAQSFVLCGERDQKNSYPSINLNEIVLPGSEVQRAMAKQMQLEMQYDEGDGDAQMEDECVICMDGFSPDNPRMPTLCGCGENKTYFHLPCLYQWIEQSRKCPSCRKKLVWEEF
jgi:hypothetical protein